MSKSTTRTNINFSIFFVVVDASYCILLVTFENDDKQQLVERDTYFPVEDLVHDLDRHTSLVAEEGDLYRLRSNVFCDRLGYRPFLVVVAACVVDVGENAVREIDFGSGLVKLGDDAVDVMDEVDHVEVAGKKWSISIDNTAMKDKVRRGR